MTTDNRNDRIEYWESRSPSGCEDAKMCEVSGFSARGMVRVYGRGDYHPEVYRKGRNGALICNLDIWQNKDERLFVRFFANSRWLDTQSYELTGCWHVTKPVKGKGLDDSWVPLIVRTAYIGWMETCVEYPYD